MMPASAQDRPGLRSLLVAVGLTISAAGQGPPFPLSQPVTGTGSGFTTMSQPSAGDFNNDARDDLASVEVLPSGSAGVLRVILTTPGGGYGPPTTVHSWPPGVANGFRPLCRDFTADGNVDIVATFRTSSIGSQTFLFAGNGAGQFSVPIPIPDPTDTPGPWHECFDAPSMAIPGGTAFLLGTKTSNPTVYIAYVVHVFGQAVWVLPAPAVINGPTSLAALQFVSTGDINGDGQHDLVGQGFSP
jgi:hypothetical protein